MKKHFFSIIRNKYLLTLLGFTLWVALFDRNDLFSQLELRKQVKQLEAEKKYYMAEVEKNKKDLNALINDPKSLEKFAREKYYMRKDNEDVFVIVKEKK